MIREISLATRCPSYRLPTRTHGRRTTKSKAFPENAIRNHSTYGRYANRHPVKQRPRPARVLARPYKTYQCGGGMMYHLDDACWLWSDRRQAWVVGKLEPAGSELSVGRFVQI